MYIFVLWKKLRWRRGGPCTCSISLCSAEHESFPVLIQKKDKHRNRTRVSQVSILMPSLNIDHQIHRRANQHPYSCIQNELVPVNGRSP